MRSSISAFALLSSLANTAYGVSSTSKGCESQLPQGFTPGDTLSQPLELTSSHGGGQRKALVHLPSTYTQKTPHQIILAFHGTESNAELFEKSSGLSIEDISKDAIVVYPDALDGTWTGSPDAPMTSERNDMSFVTDLLDALEDKFCLDKSRVFATGHDTGAGLVALMACHPFLSQRIAAFAPVSATLYASPALKQPLFEYCSPGHTQIPILSIHGEDDEEALYHGTSPDIQSRPEGTQSNHPTTPIPAFLQDWATRNGCNTAKANITAEMYEGKVARSTFRCGEGRTRLVEGWRMRDAGHAWYRRVVGDISENDFRVLDASEIVVKWFNVHELSAALLPSEDPPKDPSEDSAPENPEDIRHGTEPVAEEQDFEQEEGDHGKAYLDIGEVKIEHFGSVAGPDVTHTTTHTNVISIAVHKFETRNEDGDWTTHGGGSRKAKATGRAEADRDEL